MNVSTPSEDELFQLLKRTSTNSLRTNYITVDNYILPNRYNAMKKDIKEFEIFDTDVWICGFPKTGTTWISEIAWLIVHDMDFEGAKEVDYKRTRMLEFSMLFDPTQQVLFGGEHYERDSVGHSKIQPHPRTIKSHFPFSLLPDQIASGAKKPKIIYTARNPMDTCISYYYQCKNYEGFVGTLEEFYKLFLFGKVNYGPYPAHVLSFWQHRQEILFFTYEEMKKNIRDVIRKVAVFLGKTLSEEDITKIEKYVSFDSMKKNPAVNKEVLNREIEAKTGSSITPFIRAGKSGGYRNVMSPEMISLFRERMGKAFEGSGLNLLDN